MIGWYDRDGKSITVDEASELLGDLGYKRVASSYVGDLWISTVWLGLNRAFDDSGLLIFETMVFNRDKDADNPGWQDFQARYTAEDEALLGHVQVYQRLRAGLPL